MQIDPKCFDCKHIQKEKGTTEKQFCEAFPDGIPVEILFNEVEHTKPFEGDHGIQFEAQEGVS